MTPYETALRHALLMLGHNPPPPREKLVEIAKLAATTVKTLAPTVDIDDARLVRELEGLVTWTIGREFIIESDEDHVPWLPARRANIDWLFWRRYERYLLEKPSPLPPLIVQRIDNLTDQVLERLEDPGRESPWDRRGMIVGHVQSGKTSNFIGLICKAADAGYKIIVVLAGLHKSLRSQTQLRLDEGFLGYTSAQATTFHEGNKAVGVGLLATGYRAPANSLTGYDQDFSGPKARGLNISPFGRDPTVLVIKKHKTILTNLIAWLAGYADPDPSNPRRKMPLPDVPLLVIDDEADNASISTQQIPVDPMTGKPQPDYEVTAINGKIRQLLSLFSKKAYVGYTATPFANIFIHPEDASDAGVIGKAADKQFEIPYGEGLFPRSFIIDLPTPSNYVGPVTIFGIDPDPEAGVSEAIEPLPLVCLVTDSETCIPRKHQKDFKPAALPPSMEKAIKCFLLSCAARCQRGGSSAHNSMLIHVTRFVSVQSHLQELVGMTLKDICNRLRYGDGASKRQIAQELRDIWETEYVPTTDCVIARTTDPLMQRGSWSDINGYLSAAAQKTVVKRISGESSDVLDYQRAPEGMNVIAIGGDKLSRGLTLEGLTVSYFLRPSHMYDTLMQMGRWFGYRPGYLDLCRLFTTPDLVDWYKHITLAAEELRREFRLMTDRGETPERYGLKVRSHPNGLLVTSLLKMREAHTLKVSYDGRICETTVFAKDASKAAGNLAAVEKLLSRMPKASAPPYIWGQVASSLVVDFLKGYETHPHAPEVNSRLLAAYVLRKNQQGMVTDWTVALLSSDDRYAGLAEVGGYQTGLTFRKNETPESDVLKYTIGRLLSPRHEELDMAPEQIQAAREETLVEWRQRDKDSRSAKEPKQPSGPLLRKQRSMNRALLLIYALDSSKAGLPYSTPTIGFGISFPGDRFNPTEGIEYRANSVYIGQTLDEEDVD